MTSPSARCCSHTTKGAKILEQVPDLAPEVIAIVRSHHERWDGMGYPDNTKGDAIPELARIVAVADAFDAMTSNRPYRAGMAPELAFAEVEKQRGRQFDPQRDAPLHRQPVKTLRLRPQCFRNIGSSDRRRRSDGVVECWSAGLVGV